MWFTELIFVFDHNVLANTLFSLPFFSIVHFLFLFEFIKCIFSFSFLSHCFGAWMCMISWMWMISCTFIFLSFIFCWVRSFFVCYSFYICIYEIKNVVSLISLYFYFFKESILSLNYKKRFYIKINLLEFQLFLKFLFFFI